MHGFKKGVKPKSQHFANGGMVKGAGTGTSDDIKKEVSAGSYIMPADSTQKIGAPSLDALGFKPQAKVPVNLSNGEYEMPPEQVHAVGVQALDQMKEQTHTPVNQPQVQQGKGFKPEMFFADGGGVFDWVNKNLLPETSRVVSQTNDTVNKQFNDGNYLYGIGQGLGGGVKAAGGLAYDTIVRPVGGIASGIGEVGKGFFGVDNSPTPSAVSPVTAAAPKSPPTTAKTVPNPMAVTAAKTAQGFTQPSPTSTNMEATPQDPVAPLANNITREGNSFSGSNIGAGFTVNGQANGMGGNPSSPQNIQAVESLLARTAEFGMGQPQQDASTATQRGFNPNYRPIATVGSDPMIEQARREAFRANSSPMKGAQGGALTASQRAGLAGMAESDDKNRLSRDTTDANNISQLTQAQLRESGANERAELNELGANYRSDTTNDSANQRFNVTSNLDERRFASDQETKGFATRAARRTEKLYERYDKAGPEERKAIAQQIQELGGKSSADKFLTVQGGQEYDPQAMTLVNRPTRLFNTSTQSFVDQPNQLAPIASNPAALKIKNDTTLSVDDKRKQLQALGY